jgi:hypothetical protein
MFQGQLLLLSTVLLFRALLLESCASATLLRSVTVRLSNLLFLYYSSLRTICLPASVEFLGKSFFSECTALWSLAFESGSKLPRNRARALSSCSSLKSILITPRVKELSQNLALQPSLRQIVSESALHLPIMSETNKTDWGRNCDVKFVHRHCALDFPDILFKQFQVWMM